MYWIQRRWIIKSGLARWEDRVGYESLGDAREGFRSHIFDPNYRLARREDLVIAVGCASVETTEATED